MKLVYVSKITEPNVITDILVKCFWLIGSAFRVPCSVFRVYGYNWLIGWDKW